MIGKNAALPQAAPVVPPVMMQPPQTVLPPLQVRLQQPQHQLSLLQQMEGATYLFLLPNARWLEHFTDAQHLGKPPIVKVGDKVQKGQVVCIIEAMKLMSEVEADHSGIVVEILIEDGKPVSVDTRL